MENLKRVFIFIAHFLLLFIKNSYTLEAVSVFPGVKIVRSNLENINFSERPNNEDLFQRTFDYLKTHELKLELSSFINGSDFEKMYKNISDHLQVEEKSSTGKIVQNFPYNLFEIKINNKK